MTFKELFLVLYFIVSTVLAVVFGFTTYTLARQTPATVSCEQAISTLRTDTQCFSQMLYRFSN